MTPGKILKTALNRVKKKNPSFSQASLAKKLNVSKVFISNLLNDKEKFPMDRIQDFSSALSMDQYSTEELKQSAIKQKLGDSLYTRNLKITQQRKIEFEEYPEKFFTLFTNWYHIAVLDLLSCADFIQDSNWISKRLGITKKQVESSVNFLLKSGFIVESEGKWRKNSDYIRFPTQGSHPLIRGFHQEMLSLAKSKLSSQTSQEDFRRRQILGACLAVNPEKIPLAKQHLERALFEVAEILREGPCTELYYLSNLLFPLT